MKVYPLETIKSSINFLSWVRWNISIRNHVWTEIWHAIVQRHTYCCKNLETNDKGNPKRNNGVQIDILIKVASNHGKGYQKRNLKEREDLPEMLRKFSRKIKMTITHHSEEKTSDWSSTRRWTTVQDRQVHNSQRGNYAWVLCKTRHFSRKTENQQVTIIKCTTEKIRIFLGPKVVPQKVGFCDHVIQFRKKGNLWSAPEKWWKYSTDTRMNSV